MVTAILPSPAIFARGEPAVPPGCARHADGSHALGVYMTWTYQIGPGYIKLQDTTTIDGTVYAV